MSLTFSPKGHRYRLDGRPVPGVTTLIKDGLPAPALMYWSAKSVAEWVAEHPDLTEEIKRLGGTGPAVAFLKAIPWQQRDTAGIKGTTVHQLGEQLVHGTQVEVPEHLEPYVRGYCDWLDREQVKPLWTERPVGNRRWWYAGTFDLIAEIRGQRWLLDLKTAAGVYGSNAIQLAAYQNAEFMVDDGHEQPMPPVDRLGVIHVQDGLSELWPVKAEDNTPAWKDALHIFWTAKAKDRINNYLTEPQPAQENVA